MLRAARRLAQLRDIGVVTSFLGAHALPSEAAGDQDRYLDEVNALIPDLAQKKLAVDAFCQTIAFSPEQVARVFAAATAAGLPVKLHADQLSNRHGARLAAARGALSADHLEYTDEDGVAAMARAATVAVLLPGAFYVLREKQVPPIDTLRRHQVPMGDRRIDALALAQGLAGMAPLSARFLPDRWRSHVRESRTHHGRSQGFYCPRNTSSTHRVNSPPKPNLPILGSYVYIYIAHKCITLRPCQKSSDRYIDILVSKSG
jgi:hypothetical protein